MNCIYRNQIRTYEMTFLLGVLNYKSDIKQRRMCTKKHTTEEILTWLNLEGKILT